MPAPAPSTDIRATRTVRLRTAPAWLPEKYRQRDARIRLTFRPTAGEKRILRRRKPVPPSKWAPVHRTVTYGPLKGSRWDNSFMPHLRGIMDASFFPSVRMNGNLKVPQSGSSAGAETMLGFIADTQPSDAVIGYPDRDTAAKRSTNYLQPMFRQSPRLRSLLTGAAEDMASLMIRLQTMLIHMCWAGSVTSLGNISARYLFADEIDKWPEQPSKKEAGSLKLFLERFRAFKYGAKCWLISTPSLDDGPIWQYCIHEADVLFTYHVHCPDCGQSQPMGFDQIYWEGGRTADPQQVEKEDLARYACLHCGSLWDDRKRERALKSGTWHAYGRGLDWEKDTGRGSIPLAGDGRELFAYLQAVHPKKIAFHSPGWISPLVTNSEMAAGFLRGLKSAADMHYFDNQLKGVSHRPHRQSRKEDAVFALADDRPDRLVPGNGRVACLTAAADTQDDGFYYVVRAWGWGKQDSSGTEQDCWQVRYGFVKTLDELAVAVFHDNYQDVAGLYYPVHKLVIDAMGHRTGEVYEWSRKFPGRVQCYKGASGRKANPRQKSVIDHYPGTKIAIPGGLELLIADSHHYKDLLAARLKVKPDDAGAHHMLASINDKDPHGADYAAQMCAEYMNEKGLWVCPDGKANHYWDCEMMNIIAEDILQIKYWPKGEA